MLKTSPAAETPPEAAEPVLYGLLTEVLASLFAFDPFVSRNFLTGVRKNAFRQHLQ